MARNKTMFLYNGSKRDSQEWTVYSEDIINKSYTVGKQRTSFTLSLGGDATIKFGVDDTVYLTATYTYNSDSWASKTDTPNEISFSASESAVSVTSSYDPSA